MTPDTLAQIHMLRAQGAGYKSISVKTGVPVTTVRRVVNPEYADRLRRLSREAKRRRARPCATPGCQNLAHYAGHGGSGVSTFCRSCGTEIAREINAARGYQRDELIAELRRFYAWKGAAPRSTDYYPPHTPSFQTFYRAFGSWPAALEAAGIPNTRRPYTRRVAA